MTIHIPIPGADDLHLEHLVLDVNGTLTDRGEPIVCATAPLQELREALTLHLLSADTFRTAEPLAASLGAQYRHITNGIDKRDYLNTLGASACAAIGNGRNDAAMLKAAALGIAIIGPEGTHHDALAAADVIARSIDEALGLLIEPRTLTATLRP